MQHIKNFKNKTKNFAQFEIKIHLSLKKFISNIKTLLNLPNELTPCKLFNINNASYITKQGQSAER